METVTYSLLKSSSFSFEDTSNLTIQQLDKIESFIKAFSVRRRKINISRTANTFFQVFIIKLFYKGSNDLPCTRGLCR